MSLFSNLYKYRQKENKNERENFLTELFAYILQNDIDFRSDFFEKVIKINDFDKELEITVSTQKNYQITDDKKKSARPDVVIKGLDIDKKLKFVVFIENKVDSSLGYRIFENLETKEELWLDQLSIYDNILRREYGKEVGKENLYLVYLTKYFEIYDKKFESQIKFITWYEVFQNTLPSINLNENNILSQFKQFLIDLKMDKENNLDETDIKSYHIFYLQTLERFRSILMFSKKTIEEKYEEYRFSSINVKNWGSIYISCPIGKLRLLLGFYAGSESEPILFCVCESDKNVDFEPFKKNLEDKGWFFFKNEAKFQKVIYLKELLKNENQYTQIINFFQSTIDELREDEEFIKLSK